MRPKGNAKELEARRRRAIALLKKGWGVRETAREVGSSPSSVVYLPMADIHWVGAVRSLSVVPESRTRKK